MDNREWYNSYVKAVSGTSSLTGTIATVEKFNCVGLESTAAFGWPIVWLGFCQDPAIYSI